MLEEALRCRSSFLYSQDVGYFFEDITFKNVIPDMCDDTASAYPYPAFERLSALPD